MPLKYDQHYHPVNFMKITTEERDALDYPDDGTVIFNISNMRNEVLQQGVWVPVTPFNYTDPDWFETLTIVDGEITITGSGVYMISPESGDYDVLTNIHGGQLGDRIVLLPAPIGGASPACILLDQSGIGDGDGLMGPTTQQAQLFTDALAPTTSIGSMGLELAKGLFFGWETWFVLGTEGLPLTTNLLVGTANAGYPDLIVVGTTPGGELGGTWASPTVDATHSGSAHHASATAGADGEHTWAGQVLSGVAGTTTQIGHTKLYNRTIYGSFYARPESTTVPKLILGPMDCAGTFVKLTIYSRDVAAESAIRVDLHKRTAANEDSTTSTTVFTTQTNRPTIAAAHYAGNTTTFEVPTFADGDWLSFFLDVDDSGITVIYFGLEFTPG